MPIDSSVRYPDLLPIYEPNLWQNNFKEEPAIKYPDLYSNHQEPSAPPVDEASAPPAGEVNPFPQDKIDEECSICLEDLSDYPKHNAALPRVIAKTECNHFFHNFCLQEHLENGKNTDCPMCRAPLEEKNIITLVISGNVETQPSEKKPEEQKPSSSLGTKILSTAGKVSYTVVSLCAKGTWEVAKFGGKGVWNGAKYLLTSSPAKETSKTEQPKNVDRFPILKKHVELLFQQMNDQLATQESVLMAAIDNAKEKGIKHVAHRQEILSQIVVLMKALERQNLIMKNELDVAFAKDLQRFFNFLDGIKKVNH